MDRGFEFFFLQSGHLDLALLVLDFDSQGRDVLQQLIDPHLLARALDFFLANLLGEEGFPLVVVGLKVDEFLHQILLRLRHIEPQLLNIV